nr:unnamed protein product [Callosobruchus chinensis]
MTIGKGPHQDWLLPQWRNVLFSDESRFGLVSDDYRERRRAIRLIGDPALTCHLQPLSHRRAVGDLSLFYLGKGWSRLVIATMEKRGFLR